MERCFMKKQLELAQLLIKKAEEDEALIRAVINHAEISDEIIGFHFQQAVEKMLKAACTLREIRFSKTHNIRVLMDLLSDHNCVFPDHFEELDALTPFGVMGRYENVPFDLPFKRNTILGILEKIKEWVFSL